LWLRRARVRVPSVTPGFACPADEFRPRMSNPTNARTAQQACTHEVLVKATSRPSMPLAGETWKTLDRETVEWLVGQEVWPSPAESPSSKERWTLRAGWESTKGLIPTSS
jgi:hypothetical protein